MKMKRNIITILVCLIIIPLFAEEKEDLLIEVGDKSLLFKEKVKINDEELVFSLNKFEMENLQQSMQLDTPQSKKRALLTYEQRNEIDKSFLPLNLYTVEQNGKMLFQLGEFYWDIIYPHPSVVGTLLYNKYNNILYCLIVFAQTGQNYEEDIGDTRFHLYEIKNFSSVINAHKTGEKIKPNMPMFYYFGVSKSKPYPRMNEGISPFSIYLERSLGGVKMTCDKENLYVELQMKYSPEEIHKYSYNIESKEWSGDRRKPDFIKMSSPQ